MVSLHGCNAAGKFRGDRRGGGSKCSDGDFLVRIARVSVGPRIQAGELGYRVLVGAAEEKRRTRCSVTNMVDPCHGLLGPCVSFLRTCEPDSEHPSGEDQ